MGGVEGRGLRATQRIALASARDGALQELVNIPLHLLIKKTVDFSCIYCLLLISEKKVKILCAERKLEKLIWLTFNAGVSFFK